MFIAALIGTWFTNRISDDGGDGGWHYRFEAIAAFLLFIAVVAVIVLMLQKLWDEFKQLLIAIRNRMR